MEGEREIELRVAIFSVGVDIVMTGT